MRGMMSSAIKEIKFLIASSISMCLKPTKNLIEPTPSVASLERAMLNFALYLVGMFVFGGTCRLRQLFQNIKMHLLSCSQRKYARLLGIELVLFLQKNVWNMKKSNGTLQCSTQRQHTGCYGQDPRDNLGVLWFALLTRIQQKFAESSTCEEERSNRTSVSCLVTKERIKSLTMVTTHGLIFAGTWGEDFASNNMNKATDVSVIKAKIAEMEEWKKHIAPKEREAEGRNKQCFVTK